MATDVVGVEERYAVFPFYLCLDVSASMAGEPIEGVNRQLPAIRSSVGEDPAVAEVIRFGIVTFSDVARTVLPLCDLSMIEVVPPVVPEGRTSYAAAFDHLRELIEKDYQSGRVTGERWYRPAVIFISDGRPTDPEERWRSAHARLCHPDWKRHPNILAFGFGDADPEVLAIGQRGQAQPGLHRQRGSHAEHGRARAHAGPHSVHRQLVGQRLLRRSPARAARPPQHDPHPG